MIRSEDLYDKLAPHFSSYSKKRQFYIHTIDSLVLNNLPQNKDKVLDVGSGDGVRGYQLFEKIGAKYLVMIDNSPNMVKLSKRYKSKRVDVERVDISSSQDIRELNKSKFDIILCLWNVLGHVPRSKARQDSLKNMRELLTLGGKIFIDISNRYNIRYYGFKKVIGNIMKDIVSPSELNGDFNYQIEIDSDTKINSSCHFFNPFEIRRLIKKSGLIIEKEIPVDYLSGQIRRSIFEGHPFYILSN